MGECVCVMSAAQVSEQKKASKGTSSTTGRRRAGGLLVLKSTEEAFLYCASIPRMCLEWIEGLGQRRMRLKI